MLPGLIPLNPFFEEPFPPPPPAEERGYDRVLIPFFPLSGFLAPFSPSFFRANER